MYNSREGNVAGMVVITVEKVPKKLLDTYKDKAEPMGVDPNGMALLPNKTGGFQKVEIFIKEKMSQWDTRIAFAHELFHAFQYLSDCELDEENPYEIAKVMVKALKEKRKVKNA
jgi:hypothetical protein